MAFYNYKEVRNELMALGYLNEYAEPVDQEKYGEGIDPGYDGNLHRIAAEALRDLQEEIRRLKGGVNETDI